MLFSLILLWILLNTPLCHLDDDEGSAEEEPTYQAALEGDSPAEAISAALKNQPMQFIMPTLDPKTGKVYGVVLNDVMLNAFENLQHEPHPSGAWNIRQFGTGDSISDPNHGGKGTDRNLPQISDPLNGENEEVGNTSNDWLEGDATEEEASLLQWKEDHALGDYLPSGEVLSQSSPMMNELPTWAIKPQVEFVYVPLSPHLDYSHVPDAKGNRPLKCHHRIVVTIEELPQITEQPSVEFETWGSDEDYRSQPTLPSEEETDEELDLPARNQDNDFNLTSGTHFFDPATVTQTVYETVAVYMTMTSEYLNNPYLKPSKPPFTQQEYKMMRVAENELLEASLHEVARPRRYRAGKGILHD